MILITEFMADGAVARLRDVHPTEYQPDLADRQGDIPALLKERRALIVRNRTQVGADLLDAAPELKVVGRLGVGLDNIDVQACEARGVQVLTAAGANAESVAEYVVTSALMLLRGAYLAGAEMMAGNWPRTACSGREGSRRRLGLVGFGAIAQETARKARAMGMEVCATDPFLPEDDPAWKEVLRGDLAEVLSRSDAVSLHVPLTTETRGLIDAKRLAEMSPGAILINTSRGGVVDEDALAAAMRTGHVGGAALDVFEIEPLTAEAARKFEGIGNLILTPHIAGVTQESNVRVSEMIAENVLATLDWRGP